MMIIISILSLTMRTRKNKTGKGFCNDKWAGAAMHRPMFFWDGLNTKLDGNRSRGSGNGQHKLSPNLAAHPCLDCVEGRCGLNHIKKAVSVRIGVGIAGKDATANVEEEVAPVHPNRGPSFRFRAVFFGDVEKTSLAESWAVHECQNVGVSGDTRNLRGVVFPRQLQRQK